MKERFREIRENIIGHDYTFETPFGIKPIIYADWTASGRLYAPIERTIYEQIAPYVGNTHSHANVTGGTITEAYHYASKLIKSHVGANDDDILLSCGTGSTAAIIKLQRILGLKLHESFASYVDISDSNRPVVFVTHMEHHSNHTSWLETIADVVCLPPNKDGEVDPDILESLMGTYQDRPLKIGSFTACSNVSGMVTPYHQLAHIMHKYNGYCFVDFSASAPYVPINMHPSADEQLDAIFISPHKFLGGPGSPGVLVFNRHLYSNKVPDQPGGGTVEWTNPWGDRAYIRDIEVREDGGTPGFLQLIKAAMAFELKCELLSAGMEAWEKKTVESFTKALNKVPRLVPLVADSHNRLAIFSFYFEHLHYNLAVRLLNDLYGIQARGGCSCAGTYGHYLLNIDRPRSKRITDLIDNGDLGSKPGWVRISLHPTTTDTEICSIVEALHELSIEGEKWSTQYTYDPTANEFSHSRCTSVNVRDWFKCSLREVVSAGHK